MAVKTIHVSDISDKEADEQTLGRLVVHEHPEYSDLPVTLEALPEELEQLQGTAVRFVTVEWIRPGARKGERITVPSRTSICWPALASWTTQSRTR